MINPNIVSLFVLFFNWSLPCFGNLIGSSNYLTGTINPWFLKSSQILSFFLALMHFVNERFSFRTKGVVWYWVIIYMCLWCVQDIGKYSIVGDTSDIRCFKTRLDKLGQYLTNIVGHVSDIYHTWVWWFMFQISQYEALYLEHFKYIPRHIT